MTERVSVICYEPVQAHKAITAQLWPWVKAMTMGQNRIVVEAKRETRSLAQNARLWAMLTDISRQVEWYGRRLSPTEWKDVFTAALKRQDVVPGIDGGFVVLGKSTSSMTKGEMAELQTLMEAFGVERGVRFVSPDFVDPETGRFYR
jgi:hypothetical protein